MSRARWRRAAGVAIVALVYYAAARLGLLLQLPGTNASPFWPPSGIGLAAVLLFGPRVWPGILAGAFLANLLTLPDTPAGWLAAAAIGVGNTLEQLVAFGLLRRLVPSLHPFERARDVFWFAVTAGLSCAVASLNGATSLYLTGIVAGPVYGPVWFTWWLGDTAGMLVLAPALCGWWRAPRLRLSVPRTLELLVLVALTALTAEFLFGGWLASAVMASLPYLIVPGLLWAAFRFGPRETASLAVLVSAIAVGHTWWWMGHLAETAPRTVVAPFLSPAISANESLLMLQVFVCAVAVTAITLAAAVAERTQAEGALRDSEQRFRATFEQAAVGIAHVAPDGHWLQVNQRLCDLVGHTREELLQCTFQDITHPADLDADLALVRRVLAGDLATYAMEKRYFRKDGSLVWINLTVALVREPTGAPAYFISVIEDISARKQAEEEIRRLNAELEQRVKDRTVELEAANRELEAFSYSVSHDLRAPLRAVDGFSRILLEAHAASLPAEAQEFLRLVRNNTQLMGRLIDDLLSFARLSRQPVRKQRVEPASLVRQCLEELGGEREGRRLEITVGDLPPCRAEPSLLKQVWVNLLSNALKYTRKRDVAHIEVGCRTGGPEGAPVYFVRDNGVGFDMRYAHKLFGVFQRLHRAEDFEGSGVGLAIVQRIVQRHGGRVWAEGRPGQGAEFSFILGNEGPHDR
jgi:PAS domain S-box-containing protein